MKINIKNLIKLSKAYYDKGDFISALKEVKIILKEYPLHRESLELQFDTYIRMNDWINAMNSINKLIEIDPSPKNIINKGCIYIVQSQFQEALDSFSKVEKSAGDNHFFLINKGIALRNLYRYDEAIECLNQAKDVNPKDPYSYMHLGIIYHELNQPDQSIKEYQDALDLDPQNGDLHWNLSLTLLLKGDYPNGWKEHEWRFYQRQQIMLPSKSTSAPQWDLITYTPNMRLLVESEQGIGDIIQFMRFFKPLADKGVQVIFATTKELYHLVSQVEGLAEVYVPDLFPVPKVDYFTHLCSLPLALGITLDNLPPPTQKFQAPEEKVLFWKKKLLTKIRPRVGLVWSGNPNHVLDYRRSIPLKDFVQALPKGIEYFCLNKDILDKDLELCNQLGIKYLGKGIYDWMDTQAIINEMDLVISVSTSVPALSASMNKPTWLLLSYSADWRWLIDRSDSPWFPAMKIYRQETPGYNWDSVLTQVRKDLQERFLLNQLSAKLNKHIPNIQISTKTTTDLR